MLDTLVKINGTIVIGWSVVKGWNPNYRKCVILTWDVSFGIPNSLKLNWLICQIYIDIDYKPSLSRP